MAPLAGHKAVPTGWSKHHAPVAAGGMNARCVITDPARATPGGPLDPETGAYPPPTPFYVVPAPTGEAGWPCRVQAVQSEQGSEQAGQDSTARDYLVQLDDPNLATLPDLEVGYVVTITDATNDAHLVGLALTVRDVQHGSERFTRDVIAVHNQQTPTN